METRWRIHTPTTPAKLIFPFPAPNLILLFVYQGRIIFQYSFMEISPENQVYVFLNNYFRYKLWTQSSCGIFDNLTKYQLWWILLDCPQQRFTSLCDWNRFEAAINWDVLFFVFCFIKEIARWIPITDLSALYTMMIPWNLILLQNQAGFESSTQIRPSLKARWSAHL